MARKLGEVLVEKRIIDASQLKKALDAQLIYGGHLGTCLVELGFVDVDRLGLVLSEQFRVGQALREKLTAIEPSVLARLPAKLAERHQAVPFELVDRVLHVALVDPRNLPWLLLAIGGVKVLHEFGHALVCKHFGGEVHEMGFMLLVFSPCLYCDVSDAWRMPNKWHRIAISAAGMLVELVLASLATIVWWYAVPGLVQLVALNIMIICSVVAIGGLFLG